MQTTKITEEATEIAHRLDKARNVVIISHLKPDGDAMGSSVAVARGLMDKGCKATIVIHEPLAERLQRLVPVPCPTVQIEEFPATATEADLILVVDTCSTMQLGEIAEQLADLKDKVVVVDHHQTIDPIGDVQWIDTSAAAAGVMILELIEHMKWNINIDAAEAIATAILTDTGWLRFSSTDQRCLAAISRLIDIGIEMDRLYKRINQTDRVQKLRLLAGVLSGMELFCDGKIAAMSISRDDFDTTGASPDETENIINEALRVGDIEAAVLVVEGDDVIRASLRSRTRINVADVAASFGGGGHARASGFQHPGPLLSARDEAVKALTLELQK